MLLLEVGLVNDKIENYSKNFLTSSKFTEEIERIVKDSDGLVNYIDAIVTYCEDKQIELETVPKLLTKPLKEKIKYQAQQLNLMKRTSRGILPL
jgi:hypothetical protein